ncbi:MAG: hypothetical protein ACI4AM_05795, partial [Muribaculaceae bacterium]
FFAKVREPRLASAYPDGRINGAPTSHPQVEPRLASAYPDGPVSEAANESEPVVAEPDGHNNVAANEAVRVAEVAAVAEVVADCESMPCDTAVRCQGRRGVWLDMEQMEQEELQELMPTLTLAHLEEMLPRDEFSRGCTLQGVPSELLKPQVLDVEPSDCSDVSVRYFNMMHAVRRLIDSRRCLLFEQVRVMVNYDFTDDIFRMVCSVWETPQDKEQFMSLSRHERLHVIADWWARLGTCANMMDETQSTLA